ncbi:MULTISPECIES: DHA2 family efflux MFS transporter permease subunit [unclassified Caballeronia]|uniref:DHA2 family efflux MFS transporter permease subunit n=1 Tax=unclassified Caballeronia TaxID=2646786 RepID=UPI00202952FB|nr:MULTISPECIES: DHA2 family efflux MFS transporter permease subunit [unclassified Caballeronia]MDR5806094.1 DHA2 family efflux MFS transporter permease subunit [Caballeronia sp. LZ001]
MTDSTDRTVSLGPLPYVVAATFFMEYLDTTIIATALPQMAHSFSTSPNALSLGMSAYMIALAIFIPASGWVADRFGSRSVFFSAIVTFTLASLLCGISQNVEQFTAARVLQGIGGALMVPVGRLTVVRSVDKKQLMQAISTITWPGIVAPVVGPPIGGFITTYASWRWIFLLNLPVCLVVLLAVLKWVPNLRSGERRPFDVTGLILSGLSLTAILYGADMASQPDTNPWVGLAVVAVGLVIGVIAYRHALVARHPLIDVTTLRIPTFSVTVVTGTFTRIGIGAVPYLMPLLFQIGFGLSAFKSGLLLLASALGNLGMKALTTGILKRHGFRNVAIINCAVCGAFTIACGLLTPASPLVLTLLVIFVYGVTRSMQFTSLATLAYADVPTQQMSAANTMWNAAMQMSIGLGIAFGALALRTASAYHGKDGAHAHTFTLDDFRLAFLAAGVVTLVSIYGYVKLSRDAGHKLSGASR